MALAFPLGSAVYAQDPDYTRSGPYAGIGWAFAFEDFEDELEDAVGPGFSADVDDSFGINGRLGYRFHPYFAAELEFEWYDDFDFDVDAAGFGRIADGEIEAWSLMANVKGYLLSRYPPLQPYALAGIGIVDAEFSVRDTLGLGLSASEDETAFAWQVGGGFDFYTNENWAVNLEAAYVFPTSDLDDLDFWTLGIGVQYRF